VDEGLHGPVWPDVWRKITQFCPNFAQIGALVNKNSCPKKYLEKLLNFKTKSSPNKQLSKVNFGRFFLNYAEIIWAIFFRKNTPNAKKSPKRRNFAQSGHAATGLKEYYQD
jgi:hypothetical protein